MPLEKYEDFLELSLKQLVIQLSPISLSQVCGVRKDQTLMLLVAKLAKYFSYRTRVMQVQV